MKLTLIALVSTVAALTAGSANAGANVGVSISIGQPGFYGQIDLGNSPAPQLIYAQPVMVQRVAAPLAPLYLRVPAGYERHWKRYCGRYNACGRPVYFVRDDWYRNTYVPHYQQHYYGGGWHDQSVRDRDHDGIPDNRDRDHGQGWANGHDDHGKSHGHDRGNGNNKDRDHDHGH